MKTSSLPPSLKRVLLAATLAVGVSGSWAAPLTATAAVHTKPDTTAPTLTFLKAGTEPAVAAEAAAGTPPGWTAVELAGPFEGYVQSKDLSKELDVKDGAPIYLSSQTTAGVLAVAQKGDQIEITGFAPRWTKISLNRKLVGYINVSPAAAAPIAATPPPAPAPAATQPMASAPVAAAAYGSGTGQPVNLGDNSSLPRQFAGQFVSTRRPLTPRRPYDYALNDNAGKRYAYLDVSKLLLTEQIENYVNHSVVVFGAAKTVPGTKDIVIQVETLQLK